MPDQTSKFLFLAFKKVLVWFSELQREKDFTDFFKGIISRLFEMYTLRLCVCLHNVFLFFIITEGERYCSGADFGSSGMDAAHLSGWAPASH